ncbi:MAG: putative PEP-binding protein [Fibrobacterota bacterium]
MTNELDPSDRSLSGFLGDDSRAYADIVESDARALASSGIEKGLLLNGLRDTFDRARAALGAEIEVLPGLTVVYHEAKGRVSSPFKNDGAFEKGEAVLTQAGTGERLILSALSLHLMEQHGFFQGRGAYFRVEPLLAADMLRLIDKSTPRVFPGVPLAPGKAAAAVCLYAAHHHRSVAEYDLAGEPDIVRETARYESALTQVADELTKAAAEVEASIGKAEAEIFMAQYHILRDPEVSVKVRANIRQQKKNADYAVNAVYRQYEESFEKLDNSYLKERANDIADIRRRVLDKLQDVSPGFLCKGRNSCSRGQGRIIITETLTPAMIAGTDFTQVRGFATEHGGKGSHAAILARALGIPAVSGIHGIMELVRCGDRVLIDGDKGMVTLHPGAGEDFGLLPGAPEEATGASVSLPGTEALANVNMPEELEWAQRVHADGVGLFRTEFLFVKSNRLLLEEEQVRIYSEVVKKMEGKPVTFRLLDVGGDKPLPFLPIEKEENPALGWRGARFLLGNPDLLRTQLRALARASAAGPLRVLFPMVIDAEQFRALAAEAETAVSNVRADRGRIKLGAMFEVPSAVFEARAILALADFGSIGSNDLVQYLLAVDRNNERVQNDYNSDHPALWAVLDALSRAARDAGRLLSLCGEMAAVPGVAGRLYDIGIRSLSVSPRFVPAVRAEMARRA